MVDNKQASEIFHSTTEHLGGALDVAEFLDDGSRAIVELHQAQFNSIEEWIRKGQKERDKYQVLPIGQLHIGLINSKLLNAVAFRHGPFEFVGINSGILFFVREVALTLLGCSNFMSKTMPLDKPPIDREQLKSHFRSLPAFSDSNRFRWGIYGPESETRRRFAESITAVVTYLIVLHELGHIVRAHLEPGIFGLDDTSGFMAEHQTEPSPLGNRLSQILEIDADRYAIRRGTDLVWSNPAFAFLPTTSDRRAVPYVLCLSLNILFHILDVYTLDSSTESEHTHPVPAVRCVNALVHLVDTFQTLSPSQVPLIGELFWHSLADVNELWHAIGFSTKSHDHTNDELFEAAKSLGLQRLSAWESVLKPAMCSRLKRFGLTVDDFPGVGL